MLKRFRKSHIFVSLLFIIALAISASSCGGEGKTEEDIAQEIEDSMDTSTFTIVKFGNTLFSIPSPYQISLLVKELDIDYNKEYLNPLNRSYNYVNNYKKAMNLGVYGADLAYLNTYEQLSDAINYFSVIKILAQELGISGAFDEKLVERVDENMGNKDSLLGIMSTAYRKADKYLNENSRNDIGVLIITGGWIESLHIMVQISLYDNNQDIINRIGEQKNPLENLIKILKPYHGQSEEYTQLIDNLIDLAYEFDGINVEYKYVEPTVDPQNKHTTINSKSNIFFSKEQLKTISDKVSKIRESVIE